MKSTAHLHHLSLKQSRRHPRARLPWEMAIELVVVVLVTGVTRGASSIDLLPIANGLARPVAITHAGDNSGRLFITLQSGQIRIYNGSQVLPTPFLDISALTACCGEQGLLSVAFHPQYPANGFFYVNYINTAGNTVIARYHISANANVADPSTASILLTIAQPFSNHNGGQLQFGPDGYLYIGMGDGGSAGDPLNNAQNPQSLLGKLLRIDVNGTSPYGIPPSNPYVGNAAFRGEIWALGLRNPWRFAFDRLTGDLFIADVGQDQREEVNFQRASSPGGENYGWRLMEGTLCFNPSSGCNNGSLILPVLEYPHSLGCSITGGYRYRGSQIPQQYGTYFYGDYCSGRIWGATENGQGIWSSSELMDTSLTITAFGEDQNGELYLAHYDPTAGTIYRLVSKVAANVQMSQSTYSTGENVTVSTFHITNQGSTPVAIEFKVWLTAPGSSPSKVANTGADGSVVLPADYAQELGPLSLGLVQSTTPRGTYEFGCRILDPVTGQLLAEDLNTFTIQ